MSARTTLLTALVLAAAACAATTLGDPTGPIPGDGRKILFIGNSLTYVNDVPAIVRALADSDGTKLDVRTVAHPDYALEDHWALGEAQREIARGGWELVVMQQGPSSVEENRANLREWTKRYATEIARVGATPALYSVWPTAGRRQDFDRAIESYRLAAADVHGVMMPVASAWLAAWRRDASLELYAADGLHATPLGSYLAALVIYARISGHSPVGLSTRVQPAAQPVLDVGAHASLLQAAAAEALAAMPAAAAATR
jgi:hypothetical protein